MLHSDVFIICFCIYCDLVKVCFAAGELKVEKHLALNKIGHGKYLWILDYALHIIVQHNYSYKMLKYCCLLQCFDRVGLMTSKAFRL